MRGFSSLAPFHHLCMHAHVTLYYDTAIDTLNTVVAVKQLVS